MRQITAVDWSKGSDKTSILHICGICKTILDQTFYEPEIETIPTTIYKQCPICGVIFKEHTILEE